MAPPQKKARTGGPKSWLAILNAPAFEDIAPPPSCKDESDLSKKKTGSCGPGVRRVRFDEQAPRAIMHASLDRINRRALWYSSAELEQVREETKRDCTAIREYQRRRNDHARRLLPPDTDTFTSRGIEHLASTDALQERHISRTRHWRFVMEEQHSQHARAAARDAGAAGLNPLRLAMVSAGLSSTNSGRALLQGESDQASAVAENTKGGDSSKR